MTTAGDIVTKARQKTDMVGNNFVTDTELLAWVNDSLAELYEIIVMDYEDYNVTRAAATITTG